MSTLLLATYRDDELGDGHPLRVVLGDLATQRATRRMRVPPLWRLCRGAEADRAAEQGAVRPGRDRRTRAGPSGRAGRGPARGGRPRVFQPAGGQHPAEPLRRLRALPRRGDGLLRGPRAWRVQPVPHGLAGSDLDPGRPLGRGDGSLRADAGPSGHLAGEPDQPAPGPGDDPRVSRPGRRLGPARPGAGRGRRNGRPVVDRPGAGGPGRAEMAVRPARSRGQGGELGLRSGGRLHRAVDVRVPRHLVLQAGGAGAGESAVGPAGAVRAGDGRRLGRRGGGLAAARPTLRRRAGRARLPRRDRAPGRRWPPSRRWAAGSPPPRPGGR
jgi:hypothetical protein